MLMWCFNYQDVKDDVLGAQKAGLIGALVKTGKYRHGDVDRFGEKPNYVFEDFPQAVEFIMLNKKSTQPSWWSNEEEMDLILIDDC